MPPQTPTTPPEKKITTASPSGVNPSLPRLRTYASDMSSVIRARGETLSSIVGAEQRAKEKAKEKKPLEPRPTRARLLVGGIGVLIIAGVALVVGVLIYIAEPPTASEIPSGIVFANNTITIEADGAKPFDTFLSERRESAELLLGELERFILMRDGVALTPPEVALALGLPETVAREVVGVMVGIHAFDHNQPFVIFEVRTYDRTFNALLEWEPSAARELGRFFQPTYVTTQAPRAPFTDAIVKNLDIRQSEKSWPILYTFPSRTMLILTTNEFTLREIMTRLGRSLR